MPAVERVEVVHEPEVADPAVDPQEVERGGAHEVDRDLVRTKELADLGHASERLRVHDQGGTGLLCRPWVRVCGAPGGGVCLTLGGGVVNGLDPTDGELRGRDQDDESEQPPDHGRKVHPAPDALATQFALTHVCNCVIIMA